MLGSFTDQDWLNNFWISRHTFPNYVTKATKTKYRNEVLHFSIETCCNYIVVLSNNS